MWTGIRALGTQIWGVGGWVKVFGVLGMGALLYSIILLHQTSPERLAGRCTPIDQSQPPSALTIGDVRPKEIGIGSRLCVTVANVVDAGAIATATVRVRAASAARDKARGDQANVRAALRALPSPDAAAKARLKDAADDVVLADGDLTAANEALKALNAPRDYALFLDGKPTPARATAIAKPGWTTLVFDLETITDASSDDAAFWRKFMGATEGWSGSRAIDIGIGPVDAKIPAALYPPPERVRDTYRFVVYRPQVAVWALVGVAFLIAMIARLAYDTNMLREASSELQPGQWPRYSLAKTQIAFWPVLTIFGFVLIWVVTGQYLNVVNSSTFVLIGISGVTAASAQAVNTQQTKAARDAGSPGVPSRNFLYDLVSDGASPQVHRWQMLVWTLALGAIYVWNIVRSFVLTEFDANLLALTGIVSGVYVGLKTQEAPSR